MIPEVKSGGQIATHASARDGCQRRKKPARGLLIAAGVPTRGRSREGAPNGGVTSRS